MDQEKLEKFRMAVAMIDYINPKQFYDFLVEVGELADEVKSLRAEVNSLKMGDIPYGVKRSIGGKFQCDMDVVNNR